MIRDTAVGRVAEAGARARANVAKVIVGNEDATTLLLVALLSQGHVLIEDVPGVGKTTLAKALARSLDLTFQRVQFTPDLLPSDLVGTLIYNQRTAEFVVQRGPIFTNILLADEINRAPAKVQSALLESMQERQVTIGGETMPLPDLFLVLATQNPIEQEGTYPLPEAQVDRFLFKLVVTYPARVDERTMLDRMTDGQPPAARPVIHADDVLRARALVERVRVDARIKEYVLDLVHATRTPAASGLPGLTPLVSFGASPRAAIFLVRAAKAHAFLAGRAFVLPDDVKSVALDVLRHRIVPTYRADADGVTTDQMVGQILDTVPVP